MTMAGPALLALGSLLGVIVTAVGAYLIARRKTSGSVATTEAETLWQQTNALLDRYKADVAEAEAETSALRVELEALRHEVAACRQETAELRAEASRLRTELAAVRSKVEGP